MKRILCILLTAALLASSALAAGFSRDKAAINVACESVMKVNVYDASGETLQSGSGFVAFPQGYLITAKSLLAGADHVIAVSDKGQEYSLSLVKCISERADAAILCFEEPHDLAPLALSQSEAFRGSPVIAISSPMGFANNVSTGNVTRTMTDENGAALLLFNAPVSAGSMGGALMNDEGEVIGMLIEREGANAALAVGEICALLSENEDCTPQTLTALNENGALTREDKQQVMSFTVKNAAPFAISEVYLYPGASASWGDARNRDGWLLRDGSLTVNVSGEELSLHTTWTLNVCFYLDNRPYYFEYKGFLLKDVLGHTLTISMEQKWNMKVEID